MQLSFRRLFPIILCSSFQIASLFSQDCGILVKENKKVNNIQIVSTASLTVVVRGSYNYSIEFFTNEKGIFGRMTSVGGIEFNQDDQVVFVDVNNKEQAYRFIGMDELLPGTVPTHRNNLRLDLEAVKWLSETTITGINFINFVDRQKHKFTTNPGLQNEFKGLAACFNAAIDPTAVIDIPGAAVTKKVETPTAATTPGKKPSGTTTTGGGSATSDNEVTNLRAELEKTKENLRNDIKAEKDRAEAIKGQLQADVAAARDAANQKKLDYANEVLEARKTQSGRN